MSDDISFPGNLNLSDEKHTLAYVNEKIPILTVKNIRKTYRIGENQEVHALNGVSFTINRGDFISIMGPSGSGKTTLLNQIAALDTPSAGEIILNNHSLGNLSEKELTRIRREQVGLIFQYNNLIPVLTAQENVELPMTVAGIKKAESSARAIKLLALVGLADRAHHFPDELSGGQMQRVAVARALGNHPAIILADEPTGDLDSKTGDKIMELFHSLNQELGRTFIIVTHDRAVANKTQKILHLKDGKLDRMEILSS